ncbi:MAG: FAD-dependent oxidoreductase [Candidatus Eremiobacteraeota bacterium]|nr:FAD-dependent oxidoreductase [Candidatus Eremiobacteraeota bacterium]
MIGGGAAGLAAARALGERSLRVVLLEARDRIGGRVWSQPISGSPEPAELGAEFIHGSAPETLRLLHEAGLETVPLGAVSWKPGANGQLERDDDDFVMSAARLLQSVSALDRDESADRFLQRFAGDPALKDTVAITRAFVEGFEAAEPAIASIRAIAEEVRSGADTTTARPAGGYMPLFAYMHRACVAAGVDVRLRTIVRRITWCRGEVCIDAEEAAGSNTSIRASRAIVTLPAGVLRDNARALAFVPELPSSKCDALAHIVMGHVVKVVLSFKTRFWENLGDGRYRDSAFFRGVHGPFAAYWTLMPLRTRLVVAWVGGPKAIALQGVRPAELIELACRQFGDLLGATERALSELDGGAVHDWSSDPFARGAYSYIAVGGGDARAALAAPLDDALFFAGEATSLDGQGGTVNGALETGERAAAEVMRG